MGNIEVTLDERGRITLPNEEQKRLKLYPGTKILLEIIDDKIILRKSPSREDFIKEFCGVVIDTSIDEDIKNIWVSTDE